MKNERDDQLNLEVSRAKKALAELKKLPLDSTDRKQLKKKAKEAIRRVEVRAEDKLFPLDGPVEIAVDLLANLAAYTVAAREIQAADAASEYGELHAEALHTYPELAEVLRSKVGMDQVRVAAYRAAEEKMEQSAAVVAANEATSKYRKSIASALALYEEYEPAASIFSADVQEMREKLRDLSG